MLKNVLTEQNILVRDKVKDWEAAIEIAASPLLNTKKIEEEYVKKMIDSVHDLGPYIVISPQIAIAHARPNGFVKEVSLSLLKLHNEVRFSDEGHEASLIFVLAAVDNEQHLEILRDLAGKLGDTEIVDKLLKAVSEKEIYRILN